MAPRQDKSQVAIETTLTFLDEDQSKALQATVWRGLKIPIHHVVTMLEVCLKVGHAPQRNLIRPGAR